MPSRLSRASTQSHQRRYLQVMGIPVWELRAAESQIQAIESQSNQLSQPSTQEAPTVDATVQVQLESAAPPVTLVSESTVTASDTNMPVVLQDPANAALLITLLPHSFDGAAVKLLTAMLQAIELPLKHCAIVEVTDHQQLNSDAFKNMLVTRPVSAVLSLLHSQADQMREDSGNEWVNAQGSAVLGMEGLQLQHLLEHTADKRAAWNQLKNLRAYLAAPHGGSRLSADTPQQSKDRTAKQTNRQATPA